MSPIRLSKKKNRLDTNILGKEMVDLTIVYWRDIPAQLIIGSGRKAIKRKLSEKYEKAIDHCAMKVGAKDSDSYLKDWHKKIFPLSNSGEFVIEDELKKIEQNYSDVTLKKLIENDGWQKDTKK